MMIPVRSLLHMKPDEQMMVRYSLREESFSQYIIAGRITSIDKPRNLVVIRVSISNDSSVPPDAEIYLDVDGLCFGFETDTAAQMKLRKIVSTHRLDIKDNIPVFRLVIQDGRARLVLHAHVGKRTLDSLDRMLIGMGATAENTLDAWIFPDLMLPSHVMHLIAP